MLVKLLDADAPLGRVWLQELALWFSFMRQVASVKTRPGAREQKKKKNL